MKKRSAYNRGTSNPNAVLTVRLVREARRLRGRGWSLGQIALRLKVSKSCVQKICEGRTWVSL